MKTMGMVLYPDTTISDFTAPYEIFSRLPLKLHVLARTLAPVKTERGLQIVPDRTYDDCPPLDILLIPGGPGQMHAQHDEALLALIRHTAANEQALMVSVCTGALILGAAGLLEGKKATTHWSCLDLLPLYGAIAIDAPFVEDGRVITAAGVMNGLDMSIHLARQLAGDTLVDHITRFIEYPHLSEHPRAQQVMEMSTDMLAKNPYRKQRMEDAQAWRRNN